LIFYFFNCYHISDISNSIDINTMFPTQRLELVLRPEQVPVFNKHMDIYKRCYVSFNNSLPRCGKTFVTTKVALSAGVPIIAFGPPTIEHVWTNMRAYGAEVYFYSYPILRGDRTHQPTHGLLQMFFRGTQKDNEYYVPTQLLIDIINKGCLFVFDECQAVKNNSLQNKAVRAITQTIMHIHKSNPNINTRVMFLSAIETDDQKQVVNMLRACGVITEPKLYHKDRTRGINITQGHGAGQIIDFCVYLDPAKTSALVRDMRWDKTSCHDNLEVLFREVIMKTIGASMPVPKYKSEFIVMNGFYKNGDDDTKEKYVNALDKLKKVSHYDETTKTVDFSKVDWDEVKHTTTEIQKLKAAVACRLAMSILDSNQNAKVIISFDFNAPINMCKLLLEKYNPIILNGSVEPKHRPPLIKKFQEPNSNHRLMIANTKVVAVGIDLADPTGNYPRTYIMAPNFVISDLYQASKRIHSPDTEGVAYCYMLYLQNGGEIERSIYGALSNRTDYIKRNHPDQVEAGIKFPGEYPEFYES
ncbi:DEAD/SNF2 helicase, partial [Orpheovirus IHUMI-LCC2]